MFLKFQWVTSGPPVIATGESPWASRISAFDIIINNHYATLSFYYADFLTNVGPSKENKLVGEEVVLSCQGAIASLAV